MATHTLCLQQLQRSVAALPLVGASTCTEVSARTQAARAVAELDRKEMKGRWLSLHAATTADVDGVKRTLVKNGLGQDGDYPGCVHVKGLPFALTLNELVAFFGDLKISPGGIGLLRKPGWLFFCLLVLGVSSVL
jgi:hypothetical protein